MSFNPGDNTGTLGQGGLKTVSSNIDPPIPDSELIYDGPDELLGIFTYGGSSSNDTAGERLEIKNFNDSDGDAFVNIDLSNVELKYRTTLNVDYRFGVRYQAPNGEIVVFIQGNEIERFDPEQRTEVTSYDISNIDDLNSIRFEAHTNGGTEVRIVSKFIEILA